MRRSGQISVVILMLVGLFVACNSNSTDKPSPLATPGGLSSSINSQNQVVIAWEGSNSNGYTITRTDGSGNQKTYEVTTSPFTDTDVEAGQMYTYSIIAKGSNSHLNSSPATLAPVTVSPNTSAPSTPTITSVSPNADGSLTVAWNPVSNATNYGVYRRSAGSAQAAQGAQGRQASLFPSAILSGGVLFSLIQSISSTAGSYVDASVTVSTTYEYRIVAGNSSGISAAGAGSSENTDQTAPVVSIAGTYGGSVTLNPDPGQVTTGGIDSATFEVVQSGSTYNINAVNSIYGTLPMSCGTNAFGNVGTPKSATCTFNISRAYSNAYGSGTETTTGTANVQLSGNTLSGTWNTNPSNLEYRYTGSFTADKQ